MADDIEAAIEFAVQQLSRTPKEMAIIESINWDEAAARARIGRAGLIDPVTSMVDEAMAQRILAKAQSGDKNADHDLRVASATLIGARAPLPPGWDVYVAEALLKSIPKPGRHPLKNRHRDIQIAIALDALKERGFEPTRNRATDGRKSGSFIVAEALRRMKIANISETAVAKVWENMAYLRD